MTKTTSGGAFKATAEQQCTLAQRKRQQNSYIQVQNQSVWSSWLEDALSQHIMSFCVSGSAAALKLVVLVLALVCTTYQ